MSLEMPWNQQHGFSEVRFLYSSGNEMPNFRFQIRPFTLSALFRTCFEQVCLNRHRMNPVSVPVDQDFGKTLESTQQF